MIEFVFGAKGSGKTKKMIEMANDELTQTKGNVLFINDRDRYRSTVNRDIRFINTDDYQIKGSDELYGFLCGVMASNYDITAIFLDNVLRIIDADGPVSIKGLIDKLNSLEAAKNIKLVMSISADESTVPDFLKQ